jgi:Ras-related protein Rab-43
MESLREVEQVEALAMAELIPEIILVLESSAKDNTNVEQSFVELAKELKVNS